MTSLPVTILAITLDPRFSSNAPLLANPSLGTYWLTSSPLHNYCFISPIQFMYTDVIQVQKKYEELSYFKKDQIQPKLKCVDVNPRRYF